MRRSLWLWAVLWFMAELAWAYPLALKDDRGKTVRLPARPNRVISLTVATDEILFDLYGEAERKRLLGMSYLAWDAKYSNISQHLGDKFLRAGEDTEAIIAAKPDLVVAATFTRTEIVAQLERAGIPVFVLGKFNALSDIRGNILVIGELVGSKKEAEAMVNTYDKKLQAVRDGTPAKSRPRVLNFDQHGVIFGSDCLFDDIVTAAGGENEGRALGIKGWQPVTAERLLTLRPDFILINSPDGDKVARTEAKKAAGWKSIPAVKHNRFILIEGRYLNAASQYAAEAVEVLHAKLFATAH